MARRSADSILNSLKGKIRFATVALAFFVSVFGIFAYLLISLFVGNTFYAIFVPFLLLSFAVMFFGWWLSQEVIRPIEKVSLLAKSLERSSTVSLPKTSGSTETDELLQTLHRNSQQLQNIVNLMDKVAGGQLDVVLTPLQNSDRLTNSFQQLLAKVSESIHAKQQLEIMESAVGNITSQIARIRRGNLEVELTADFAETREISETFRYLVHQLNELVGQIRRNSSQTRLFADEIGQTIQAVILENENKAGQINQTALTLKKLPNSVQKTYEELAGSIAAADYSIEKARQGSAAAQENLAAVGALRKQLQEAIKRTRQLNERSQEIAKAAKTIEDLAHRTNLVALNASIQAVGQNEKGSGFIVLAEEVERLSARAENTRREVSSLNKSISAEISEVENTLVETLGKSATLSQFAVETGDSLGELEKYVGQFLNLQIKLAGYSREQALESEKSFEIFNDTISITERTVGELKKSETGVVKIFDLMKNLENAAADFKLTPTDFSVIENTSANGFNETVKEFETKIFA